MKKQRVKNSAKFDAAAARAYAFLLLKFRLRSQAELKQRLKQKGFCEELAQETVDFLKDKEFIDDRVFACGWIATRLRQPFGLRKIKQELAQKGIDPKIIEDSLGKIKDNYDESQIVGQLAQKRFSRIKNVDRVKAQARVYAYLLRRGFSGDLVAQVVKKL